MQDDKVDIALGVLNAVTRGRSPAHPIWLPSAPGLKQRSDYSGRKN